MGAVMAYGAYLPEGTPIATTSVAVVLGDTAIALLAGLVIFPIVFANGLNPASGPGLIFETLPLAFGQMSYGSLFGTLFFILLSFAAWTSSIGLLEPAAVWLVESREMSRPLAVAVIGSVIWALGFVTIFSFNLLQDVVFWRGTLFQNLDHLASNFLLPLSGLSITLFAGWVMARNSSANELDMGTGWRYRGWHFLTRYIAPAGVLLLFLNASGVLEWLKRGA